MNPITLIGAAAAVALLAYTHSVTYRAGQHDVRSEWNVDIIKRKTDLQVYKDKLISLERQFNINQKEAQDARERELAAREELLALQRTRTVTADKRLRDANAELAARLTANAGDSAALAECKAAGAAFGSVLDSCVAEYRRLGDDAQVRLANAIDAGLECERTYDSVEHALKEFVSP